MNLSLTKTKKDVAWFSSTSEKIFGDYGTILVPFSAKLISDLVGELNKKVIAFHVQSDVDLPQTISIQKTNKTISASRNKILNPDKWQGPSSRPRLTLTNIVVKIEGNMILGNSLDIFSTPDEKGMRWVSANNLRFNIDSSIGNANKSLNSIDFEGVFEPIILAIEKWKNKNKRKLEPLYEEYASKKRKSKDTSNIDVQKEKYLLVKEFFDVANDAFKNNKSEIVKEYSRLLSDSTVKVQKGVKNYDEYLISNFKIISIFIPKTSEFVDEKFILEQKIEIDRNESMFYKLS